MGRKLNVRNREERAITYAQGAGAGLIVPSGYTGIPVTEQTALGISALWCGIRVIAEAVGSLPPTLYQDQPSGKSVAKSHPLYHLLYSEPNPEQTRPVMWETAQAHALIYGNAFLEIVRDSAGRPKELWNIHPLRVMVGRNTETGKLVYRVNNSPTGSAPGAPLTLAPEDVLHVPGLSPDGTMGYQLLKVLRDSIGFGLGAQRYGCSLFRNMGRPAGVINVPQGIKLNEDGERNLRRSFQQEHSGDMVGTTAVMQQGHTFQQLTQATNEQTQYKDLLNFFVYEVARMLNVPPFKIHSLDEATWNNAGAQQRSFVNDTLRPWLEKWEAEIEKKLLLPDEKGRFYVEFDTDCLLRADDPTRFAAYATASGNAAWLLPEEIRERENLPPMPKEPAALVDDKQQPQTDGVAAVEAGAPVQDTALNGAQIASLLLILDKLATGLYPPTAVAGIIKASFPAMSEGTVSGIVNSLNSFTPEEPPASPPPAQEPPVAPAPKTEDTPNE